MSGRATTAEPGGKAEAKARKPAQGAAFDAAKPGSAKARSQVGIPVVRIVLASVVCLGLVWLIVTRSLVAYLATVDPATALKLAPNDPQALLNLVERRMAPPLVAAAAGTTVPGAKAPAVRPGNRLIDFAVQGTAVPAKSGTRVDAVDIVLGELNRGVEDIPADERKSLENMVLRALAANPTSARAYRLLGQLVYADGDRDRAIGLMQEAARRSLHETFAVFVAMRHSLATGDHARALELADALMRTRTALHEATVPTLSQLAEIPEANPLLKKLLATKPRWRLVFFQLMTRSISDARTPLDLLLSLKDTSNAPIAAELQTYIAFLISRNFHDLAYATWLQFLPPEQLASAGFLFNGEFSQTPSGLPFDWIFAPGSGAYVGIGQSPDQPSGRSLRIELSFGRVELGTIQQRVMLAPGAYRLSLRQRGELSGRRGLRWQVACAEPSNVLLGEAPMLIGVQRNWLEVEAAFIVPGENCRSQFVRLIHDVRSASEKITSGTAWYDQLRIARQ